MENYQKRIVAENQNERRRNEERKEKKNFSLYHPMNERKLFPFDYTVHNVITFHVFAVNSIFYTFFREVRILKTGKSFPFSIKNV